MNDVAPTCAAVSFIFCKSMPVGSVPFSLTYLSINVFLNSLDVCNASNEASPADE